MVAPQWPVQAWAWVKRNWKWLLFPIGVLAYVVGRATAKTNVTVVSPGLVEHEEVKNKLDAEAAQKKHEADVQATEQLAAIETARKAAVDAERQKQVSRIDEVQGSPEKVTDLLKQIGKDIRK